MKTTKTIILLFLFPAILLAQKIENTASFRDIKASNYFRFNYDNDYFTGTDQNYTQGYNFELVAPIFKKNPINIAHLPTLMLVIGYPIYWAEMLSGHNI